MSVGKTVYKKNPDGSRGEKVGTTKGSVKDYLAALYMHADKKKKKYSRKIDTKMKDYGDIDEKKKIIRINPKKGDVINTILHEEEHQKDMKAGEKVIKKRALKKEKSLSVNDSIKLLKKYSPKRSLNRKGNDNLGGDSLFKGCKSKRRR
jgi:hypothetical protein